jgi:PKD repeat protein
MSLSEAEVVDGFTDPCMVQSVCFDPSVPPDSSPSYASIRVGPDDSSFLVMRPLREPLDENGNNIVQTPVDGDLTVTFHVLGNVLVVGPPSQSATSVARGGSVRFGPPTSVTFDGTPDTNQPFAYAWDFGDGHTGAGPSPANVYAAPGTYPVFVTVTDAKQDVGVSKEIAVQVTGPPPPPKFVPVPPPPPPPKPVPTPPVIPHVSPRPAGAAPVSSALVKPAVQSKPVTGAPATSHVAPAKLKLSTDGGGPGSGTGTGTGNGTGSGSGRGSATGAAGGTGQSAQGVALGGAASGGSPSPDSGSRSTATPPGKVSGLVGVLINPSGGVISLSAAVSSAASHVAAAARALAGGGRSPPVSWWEWLLGGGLFVLVMAARALDEFEPRAAYRALRKP